MLICVCDCVDVQSPAANYPQGAPALPEVSSFIKTVPGMSRPEYGWYDRQVLYDLLRHLAPNHPALFLFLPPSTPLLAARLVAQDCPGQCGCQRCRLNRSTCIIGMLTLQ